MEKDNKKKTLTISSDLKKKIDTTSISTDGKKYFAVKKKEPFRGNKNSSRVNPNYNSTKSPDLKKKNFLAKSLKQKLYQQKVVPNKKTYNRKKQSILIK